MVEWMSIDACQASRILLVSTAFCSFFFGTICGAFLIRRQFDKQIKKVLDNE